MKKFTKGCLMTALVLFIVGLVLCGVCGLLGGFRQLEDMGRLNHIPFVWHVSGTDDWRIGFFRSEGYDREELEALDEVLDIEDIEDREVMDVEEIRATVDRELEKKWKEIEKDGEQLALTAETLGSLEIDVGVCNVVIWKSDDEHVWFLSDASSNRPHYSIENEHGRSKLVIENEVKHHLGHWRNDPNDTVYLRLPEGCALEECDISMGAGYMDSIFIKAKEVKVNLGAGQLVTDGFEAEEISFLVGAGEILADRVTAKNADFEVGAGHMRIDGLSVSGETDLEVNLGQAEIDGIIAGDLDVECEMGEIVMCLADSEDDHSYEVECGMGTVTVGSYSRGGFASHKTWNSGKNSEFEINCNMGNVVVTFDK